MKDVIVWDNAPEKTEVGVKKKKEVEHRFEGTIKPRIGHKVWEINEETGDISEAKYKKSVTAYLGDLPIEQLIIKPDCIYIPALNASNAKKKYLKNKEQAYYFHKDTDMDIRERYF
jgi:hypothetical protein